MPQIFCVQDRSGTAAQLTIETPTTAPIEVGDTGVYDGRDFNGVPVSLDFTVGQTLDSRNFCITTILPTGAAGDVTKSKWPKFGTITWLTGENSASSPDSTVVTERHVANAYISVEYLDTYNDSRGAFVYPDSPVTGIEQAIVTATAFLDQRYRYKGIKLLQYISQCATIDPLLNFLDPWLFTSGGVGFAGSPSMFAPSATMQYTQWPRQGVTDYSGDQVYGVPQVIQEACCEAALRVLTGTVLQPDYDPDIVGNGGIIQSISDEVGPLKTSRTFDTKLGIGFFPDIPQIRRMLSKAGILQAGGGRTIIL